MRRSVFISLLILVTGLCATAQQGFKWSVDFGSVFENREGDDYYSPDQTLIFTRLSPEVGFSFAGGEHNIMGGVSWMQLLGNGWKLDLYQGWPCSSFRVATGYNDVWACGLHARYIPKRGKSRSGSYTSANNASGAAKEGNYMATAGQRIRRN